MRSTGTRTGESHVRLPLKMLYIYRPSGLVRSSTTIRKISTCRTLLSVTGIGCTSLFHLMTTLKFLGHEQGEDEVLQRRIHTIPPFRCYRRSQPSVKPMNTTNVRIVTTMISTSIDFLLVQMR